MTTASTFKWDPKFKQCFDSVDMNDHHCQFEQSDFHVAGLLEQIGVGFADVLMDWMTPNVAKVDDKDDLFTKHSSKLTAQQQKFYLSQRTDFENMEINDKRRSQYTQNKNFPIFKALKPKVIMEQTEFAKHAMQQGQQSCARYDYLSEKVLEYAEICLATKMRRLRNFPRQYNNIHEMFNIAVTPFVTDAEPTCRETPIVMGDPARLSVPEELVVSSSTMTTRSSTESHENFSSSLLIDPNVEKLVPKWRPEVVISLSALRTLTCNFSPYLNEWEMPMVVKQFTDSSGRQRNVVLIEKSLPSKSQNAREKNHVYFKKAVKETLYNYSLEQAEAGRGDSRMTEHCSGSFTKEIANEEDDVSEQPGATGAPSSGDEAHRDKVAGASATPVGGRVLPQPHVKGRDSTVKLNDEEEAATNPKARQESSLPSNDDSLVEDPCPSTDSEEERLVIDDDDDGGAESGIPQLDGASDKKSRKKSLRSGKQLNPSEKKNASPSEVGGEAPSETPQSLTQADIWKKSFSKRSRPGLPKLLDKDSLGPSAFSSPWRKRAGDPDPNKASAGNDRNKSDRDVTSSEGAESEVSQPLSISYGVTEPLLRDTADSLVDAPRSSNSQSPDSQSKRVTRSSARKRGKSGASSTDESAGTVLKVASDLFGPSSKKRRTHVSPCSVAKGQESDRGKTAPEKNPDVQSAVATKLSSPPLQPIAQKRDPVPCPAEQGGGSDSAAASARVAHSFPSVAATALATQRPTVRIRAKQKQRTIAKVTVVAKVNMSNSDASRPSTSTDVLGQILKVQDAPTAARGGASKTADVRPDVASVPVDLEPSFDQLLLGLEKRPDGKPCFYSLWEIGGKRVMIRGGLHGRTKVTRHSSDKFYDSFLSIRTKLEYQLSLGYEQLTMNEACSEWIDLLFKPSPSTVLRCRVDPFLSKVVCAEPVYDLRQLQRESAGSGFSSCSASLEQISSQSPSSLTANKLLSVVFGKLTDPAKYPPGTYLVCHRSTSCELVTRSAKGLNPRKTVIYDLEREYVHPGRLVHSSPSSVPWVPLDPIKQLPWQKSNFRIPMTFEPCAAPHPASKKSKSNKKKKKH